MNVPSVLKREVGLPGAVLIGLGSIIGTGVFVSLSIGAGLAGSYLLPALIVAGILASCNGLSSAQLAASFPVSGGTYEYGYRTLGPWSGFTAGWTFLCAKSASCATAALGFAGYLLNAAGISDPMLIKCTAALSVLIMTVLVSSGLKRSNQVNAIIVTFTLIALGVFGIIAFTHSPATRGGEASVSTPAFLEACALMFVAFTGYGRIATLGEEIREPRRNIPRAVVLTLSVALALYLLVGAAAMHAVGPAGFADAAGHTGAALASVARSIDLDWLLALVTTASITAMLGVQLNLILGLSRVMLAMGRRNDLPARLSRLNPSQSPTAAIWATGAVVVVIALLLDFRASWSFSAFTVLLYYAVTNLAALRLQTDDRFIPKIISVLGFVICAALAVFVDVKAATAGLAMLAAGAVIRKISHGMASLGTGHSGRE